MGKLKGENVEGWNVKALTSYNGNPYVYAVDAREADSLRSGLVDDGLLRS
jgi:hypothetical protein